MQRPQPIIELNNKATIDRDNIITKRFEDHADWQHHQLRAEWLKTQRAIKAAVRMLKKPKSRMIVSYHHRRPLPFHRSLQSLLRTSSTTGGDDDAAR